MNCVKNGKSLLEYAATSHEYAAIKARGHRLPKTETIDDEVFQYYKTDCGCEYVISHRRCCPLYLPCFSDPREPKKCCMGATCVTYCIYWNDKPQYVHMC